MLINQSPQSFTKRSVTDGGRVGRSDTSAVGVVAASAAVEARYIACLTQSGISDVLALGLSTEGSEASDLGCILMVLDDGPWSEAVIGRCADLKAQRGCKIICLYESDLDDAVRRARNLDIFIFLRSDAPHSVIASAVVLARHVNAFALASGMVGIPPPDPGPPPLTGSLIALTSRQTEVLHLLAKGCSNKAMARSLFLSEPTIKLHLTALRRIFNASNRTEVLSKALKLGILPF
jgi:DNA-binding NarL/FixJ family response regulator